MHKYWFYITLFVGRSTVSLLFIHNCVTLMTSYVNLPWDKANIFIYKSDNSLENCITIYKHFPLGPYKDNNHRKKIWIMKAGCILLVLVAFVAALARAEDADFCHDLEDGYYPDPKNCIKYYHCFNHAVEAHLICPNGNKIVYLNNDIDIYLLNILSCTNVL